MPTERNARLCALKTLPMLVSLGLGLDASAQPDTTVKEPTMASAQHTEQHALSEQQQAIIPIAAHAAVGNLDALDSALQHGLDAGLSLTDCQEILIQLYAYAGFPRSLNALGRLKTVVEKRQAAGLSVAPGRAPQQPIPTGDALLAAGTDNQTRLVGATVQGPLFEFVPVINQYLRSHLFGDIFARDNFDWQSRELATLGMLAAMEGVESQLGSHMRVARNTGLSLAQLKAVGGVLQTQVNAASATRAQAAWAALPGAEG